MHHERQNQNENNKTKYNCKPSLSVYHLRLWKLCWPLADQRMESTLCISVYTEHKQYVYRRNPNISQELDKHNRGPYNLTSFMWNGQLRLLPRWLREGRGGCVFHLRWEKLWDDPTFSCAIVLVAGWKQHSHTQPLPCCHRSVSTDTQQGQKLPYIKETAKWLNKNLFSLETPHIRKIKEQMSCIMRTLKWKLTKIDSFVVTKYSSNLNREQLWHIGKNTGLGAGKPPLIHSGHSLSVWLDKPENLSFPSHRVGRMKWGCVYEWTSSLSEPDARMRDDWFSSFLLSFSPHENKESPVQEAECRGMFYVCWLCQWYAAWLEGIALIFPTLIFSHVFECQK